MQRRPGTVINEVSIHQAKNSYEAVQSNIDNKKCACAKQAETEAKTDAEIENKDSFKDKWVVLLFKHFEPAQVSFPLLI